MSDPRSTATTFGFLVIEFFSMFLSLYLFLVIVTELRSRTIAPLDGLAVIVTIVAPMIGIYRIAVLVNDITGSRWRPLQPNSSAVFTFSGCYLIALWAILHINLSLGKHSQAYISLVSQ